MHMERKRFLTHVELLPERSTMLHDPVQDASSSHKNIRNYNPRKNKKQKQIAYVQRNRNLQVTSKCMKYEVKYPMHVKASP